MIVLHLLKTSIGATWALRQMRELVKMGVEVHVALPSGGRYFEEYKQYGINTHDLQTDFDIRGFRARTKSLRNLVKKIKPDIIHSHFVGTTLTMRVALRGYKIPRIFQVPGPLHLEHAPFKIAEILSSNEQDFWIGSCKKTIQYYHDAGIKDNKLFLSYYGTDIHNFHRTTSNSLRESLKISPNTKIIGTVAFMYAPKRYLNQTKGIKGHEDLIDAVKLGIDGGYDLALVIVGGAWKGAEEYERGVREYARSRLGSRVHFLGFRSDVAELYSEFDVAVHASHSENVGGALESLLLNVPTVATRVGGFPDLIEENATGWLAEPKNPPSLWNAVARALKDPELTRHITNVGRQKAVYLFDVQRTAREIFSIYEIILENRRIRGIHG